MLSTFKNSNFQIDFFQIGFFQMPKRVNFFKFSGRDIYIHIRIPHHLRPRMNLKSALFNVLPSYKFSFFVHFQKNPSARFFPFSTFVILVKEMSVILW